MNVIVFQVYVPQVLELIEISPVNSDLQLAALRLLTNLSVTDKHQYLLKGSIKLLLSLLVVSNETLQVGFCVLCSFVLVFVMNYFKRRKYVLVHKSIDFRFFLVRLVYWWSINGDLFFRSRL